MALPYGGDESGSAVRSSSRTRSVQGGKLKEEILAGGKSLLSSWAAPFTPEGISCRDSILYTPQDCREFARR